MTTLIAPSLELRLLQSVKEEVEAKSVEEWPPESLETCLVLVRKFRERTVGLYEELNEALARGVEARSFSHEAAGLRAAVDDFAAAIRELIDKLSSAEDSASTRLLAEVHALAEEVKAYRDLFAEALARVSAPPPSMDWDRLKQEADADFAAGRLVRFTTPEEMVKGLAGPD